MENRIPTNRGIHGATLYASKELVESLASYEECAAIEKEHGIIEEVEYYWYDNSAWNKNEPLGLISREDAIEEDKPGCAFIYFETTIPAFSKKAVSELKNTNQ